MSNIFTTLANLNEIKSVAIGCFDGLHRGHFELFKHLEKNSALIIIDKKRKQSLTPFFMMKELVSFKLIFLDFESIKNMSGKEFLASLEKEFVNLEKIVVGYDFAFGKDRLYKALDIQKLSRIPCVVVDEFKLNNISVHSKQIREFLSRGEIERANFFLGRNYTIKARIIKGQGLGKKELLPTLNLELNDEFLLPLNGVYASFTKIENKSFKSVSFVGNRLTTDGNFSVETHILDESFKELEQGEISISFKAFLRQNQKFDNLKELKKSIEKDCKKALEILKEKDER